MNRAQRRSAARRCTRAKPDRLGLPQDVAGHVAILDADLPATPSIIEVAFGATLGLEAAVVIAERRDFYDGPLYIAVVKPQGGQPYSVLAFVPEHLAEVIRIATRIAMSLLPIGTVRDVAWRVNLPDPDQARARELVNALGLASTLRPA